MILGATERGSKNGRKRQHLLSDLSLYLWVSLCCGSFSPVCGRGDRTDECRGLTCRRINALALRENKNNHKQTLSLKRSQNGFCFLVKGLVHHFARIGGSYHSNIVFTDQGILLLLLFLLIYNFISFSQGTFFTFFSFITYSKLLLPNSFVYFL